MSHDDLCPLKKYMDCQCQLIAKVRADEREKVAREIEKSRRVTCEFDYCSECKRGRAENAVIDEVLAKVSK